MNREIKFRFWDKQQTMMCNEVAAAVVSGGQFANEMFSTLPKYIVPMQFTGLKDKNGKEIYEGDVVKLDSWAGVQQIVFLEGAFCLADKNGEFAGDIHYIHHAGIEQAEVIGSIYENPELLKHDEEKPAA